MIEPIIQCAPAVPSVARRNGGGGAFRACQNAIWRAGGSICVRLGQFGDILWSTMRAKGCKKLVVIRARFGRETDVTAKGEQNGPIGAPVPSVVKATVAWPLVVTCAAASELWPLLMVPRGQKR